MNTEHFYRYVVADTLEVMAGYNGRMDSLAARALILGTAMVESDLQFLQQHAGGPAQGFYQMEPTTHTSIWVDWLAYAPEVRDLVRSFAVTWTDAQMPMHAELRWNLRYATAMCRLRYWFERERMPDLHPMALAGYHERHYNSRLGALGRTPELEALPTFTRAVALVKSA